MSRQYPHQSSWPFWVAVAGILGANLLVVALGTGSCRLG